MDFEFPQGLVDDDDSQLLEWMDENKAEDGHDNFTMDKNGVPRLPRLDDTPPLPNVFEAEHYTPGPETNMLPKQEYDTEHYRSMFAQQQIIKEEHNLDEKHTPRFQKDLRQYPSKITRRASDLGLHSHQLRQGVNQYGNNTQQTHPYSRQSEPSLPLVQNRTQDFILAPQYCAGVQYAYAFPKASYNCSVLLPNVIVSHPNVREYDNQTFVTGVNDSVQWDAINAYNKRPADNLTMSMPALPNYRSSSTASHSSAPCTNMKESKDDSSLKLSSGVDPMLHSDIRSGSSEDLRNVTSIQVFQKYIREVRTPDNNIRIDCSGVISRACYEEWLATRKVKLKKPEDGFRKCLVSHITRTDGGSRVFLPRHEAAIIELLRPRKVWPCFEGRFYQDGKEVTIGIKGLRAKGFHEAAKTKKSKRC